MNSSDFAICIGEQHLIITLGFVGEFYSFLTLEHFQAQHNAQLGAKCGRDVPRLAENTLNSPKNRDPSPLSLYRSEAATEYSKWGLDVTVFNMTSFGFFT